MWSLLRLVSLRHFTRSPLRTALTVFGIVVGVATLVGITAINRSVMDAFRSTIDVVAGKADLTVAAETTGFPEELLDTVRAVPGVTHASGGLTVVAPVKDSPADSLYLVGVDLLDDGYFRTYESTDTDMGKLADDLEFLNSTDRLMLSERYAKEHGLKTGSTLTLVTPEGAKDFVVHGLLKETGPTKAFGGSVAVMFFGSLQEAFNKGRRFDRIDVAIDKTVGLDAMKERLRAAVGPTIEVDSPDRRGQSVETMVRSFQLGLNLGSAVALLVGVFLVYNTVSIGVVQRRREIGTLRALGASRWRILGLFMTEAGVLGTLGSVLGLPFGLLIGRAAIAQVSESVSTIYIRVNAKDVQLGLVEVGLGLVIGIGGSILAALWPAWVASRVQPVEALRRDVAVGAGAVQLRSWPTWVGAGLLAAAYPATLLPPPKENLPLGAYLAIFGVLIGTVLLSPLLLRVLNKPLRWPGQAAFGIAGRLAADNFARAPVRTAVPVGALSIGVSMAISITGFVSSFQASTEAWIDQAVPADLFITSSAKLAGVQNQPMSASIYDEVKSIPGVGDSDAVRIYPHDVLGLRIFIISLTPSTYEKHSKAQVLSGHRPTAEEREQGWVTVSENFARRRNLSLGDSFPVNTPSGQLTYRIAGITIDYTSDQGSIVVARDLFVKQFQDDRVDTFHVYLAPGAQLETVRGAITAKLGKKFDLFVLSNAELRAEALSLVSNAFSITYAMELLAVVLALLGIVNTLLAAVLDRTREVGLLRGVGANRRHVMLMFVSEAAFIGAVGGVIGLIVGGVVGEIVTRVVGLQSTGWNFPFHYPWAMATQMLVVAAVCAVVAGIYPAWRAARLDVVEALSYE
jgi:putative ABC transport system permease protein